jgi:hypothetical protein
VICDAWIYHNITTKSNDFVYVPDVMDETIRDVIMSIPDSEPVPIFVPNSVGNSITVQIQGEKGGVPFKMSTTILRRT